MDKEYDCLIIGAGMSGMAAGIRLAMYGKKVAILEKHSIGGGLNSYYNRGKREFDVGLHALTNFARPKEKKRPLLKLLKQLRIPYNDLALEEQTYSHIKFPQATLRFTNDFEVLKQEIHEKFPASIDGLIKLVLKIENFNETSLELPYQSAKEVLRSFINDKTLVEMLIAPLLIYGSAWENDMDFAQFCIMFKSLYFEGFSRPQGGVRRIIRLLESKLEEVGCPILYKTGVEKIITRKEKVEGVLTQKGDFLKAPLVLSSAGHPETLKMLDQETMKSPSVGKLSFCESILIADKKPSELNQEATIIFYNEREEYLYQRPPTLIDSRSGVVCFPNNFNNDKNTEALFRVTMMANYSKWANIKDDRPTYLKEKEEVYSQSKRIIENCLGQDLPEIKFKDVFSPTTIARYTGHAGGTVYGSPDKLRDGKTKINGLALCGTDQGFLGIVGSMLSGISMANLYGLMDGFNHPLEISPQPSDEAPL
jgi:phytoene dehydrogenase-like protein